MTRDWGLQNFHENHMRIDCVDTEKLTFILDQLPLSDRYIGLKPEPRPLPVGLLT